MLKLRPNSCQIGRRLVTASMLDSTEGKEGSTQEVYLTDELGMIPLLRMFSESDGIVKFLPDGAFSATDSHDGNHGPQYCRIGWPKGNNKSHAWCANATRGGNSITVDMTSPNLVTGVATQGRGEAAQWVTDYSIETSVGGHQWDPQGTFVGNFDQQTICKNTFQNIVLARFVKFTVLKFHGHPSMRLDVLVYDISKMC